MRSWQISFASETGAGMLAGQGAGVSARRMLLRKARRMAFREKSATNAYIAAGGIHLFIHK